MYKIIENDILRLEKSIENAFCSADFSKIEGLDLFVMKNSKRIRSVVALLILHMLDIEVKDENITLLTALELIHSATLLHDDVLDCAKTRRNMVSICARYDNKVATISGDFLLSIALNELAKLAKPDIISIFAKNILKTCKGELSQQLQKKHIPSFDDYIKKSENKTGLLFMCGTRTSLLLSQLCDENFCEKLCEGKCKNICRNMADFALKFGTAFQILNDINSKTDFKNGIYTLPYIYFARDKRETDISNIDEKYFDMARKFLKDYINEANSILDIYNNEYAKVLRNILFDLGA